MMNLNGLYILLMVLLAGEMYLIGYLAGKAIERKNRDKEMKILNQQINELLGYIPEDRFTAGRTKEEEERLMELAR